MSAVAKDGQRWGRWEYKAANLTLMLLGEKGLEYEVDLERCNDSAGVLDWIVQVSEKVYVSPIDVGHLVRALNELSGGLQDKVCGGAVDSKFDFGAFLRK